MSLTARPAVHSGSERTSLRKMVLCRYALPTASATDEIIVASGPQVEEEVRGERSAGWKTSRSRAPPPCTPTVTRRRSWTRRAPGRRQRAGRSAAAQRAFAERQRRLRKGPKRNPGRASRGVRFPCRREVARDIRDGGASLHRGHELRRKARDSDADGVSQEDGRAGPVGDDHQVT